MSITGIVFIKYNACLSCPYNKSVIINRTVFVCVQKIKGEFIDLLTCKSVCIVTVDW